MTSADLFERYPPNKPLAPEAARTALREFLSNWHDHWHVPEASDHLVIPGPVVQAIDDLLLSTAP